MRRYLARVIGVFVGVPAGPVGILFGFLIGTLVDQFRRDVSAGTAFERYVTAPHRERSDIQALHFAAATFVAVGLQRVDDLTDARIGSAAGIRWPDRSTVERRRRSITDAARNLSRVSIEGTAQDLLRRYDAGSRTITDRSIEQTVTVVGETCLGGPGEVNPEAYAYLELLVDQLQCGCDEIVTVAARGQLDGEALRILGVPADADATTVKSAYRRLVADMHPDTGLALDAHQREELSGAFIRIHEAYRRLAAQVEARDRFLRRVTRKR